MTYLGEEFTVFTREIRAEDDTQAFILKNKSLNPYVEKQVF